ncbi:SpaA isopeptide-forming pilin-related protein [Listeria ivanovii subsp. ivanovii]
MKIFTKVKKLAIATIIILLVCQNISPVFATMTDVTGEKTATLKILKEDKETQEKIDGSVFEIKNNKTDEIMELQIEEDGTGTANSLSYGDYLVKEKTAAEGYSLDEKEYNVTLTEKEKIITSFSTKKETQRTEEKAPNAQTLKSRNLEATITENIFKEVILKDGNGNEFNTSDRIVNGSGVILNMNFSFVGKNYKKGDTFTTTLSDRFNFGTKNLSGNFLPSTEAEWLLDVNTRQLTIKFLKDGVQEGDYNIALSTAFKRFDETDETGQKVVFETAGNDTVYQVEIIPTSDYPTTVNVTPYPSRLNPEKISVDAKFNLTKEADAIGLLELNDFSFGGDTVIDRSSIKVYSSDVSAGGTFMGTKKALVEGTDYTFTYDATSLKLTLVGGLAGKGYQVLYDRIINKPSTLTRVSTQALTKGDTGLLSGKSGYVNVLMTSYKHLKKSASYNSATKTIDWTIEVNYDEANLTPATVLTDVLDDTDVLYVDNSLRINGVTFDEGTGTPIIESDASNDWDISTISQNGSFNLTYNSTTKKAYQIKYSTKLTKVNEREITNKVTDQNGVAAESTLLLKPDLLQKSGGGIDYFNNKMTWQIVANSDKIKMKDLTIIDEFSTGVKSLLSHTVKAYTDDNNFVLLEEGKDYTINKDVVPAGFKITLIGDYKITTKKIVVDMVTSVDLTDVTNKVSNKATLHYRDEIDQLQTIGEIVSSVTPEATIMLNGDKYGYYNKTTGNIDWIVSVNTMGEHYDNLIFNDDMPMGTAYVEGSLQFRKVNSTDEMLGLSIPLFSKGTLAKPGEKNYPTKIDISDIVINLEFEDFDNSRVFIKYSTKPTEKWYSARYVNNIAKVSDNGKNEKSYSKEVYSSYQFNAIKKTGDIDATYGNKVNWKIELSNISPERPITNPAIIDVLDIGITGAQLVKNSFRVINQTTGEVINSNYYDIIFEENTFRIEFKNYIATAPIEVDYSTISLMSGTIKNSASVSSTDYGVLPYNLREITANVAPAFTIGSGDGIATVGSLKVTKVDNTKKLAGAEFKLYTLEGEETGVEGTTNADGEVIFDGIQSGKYNLVETEAPVGYTINDEYKTGKEITIGAEGSVVNYTIENTAINGNVVLTKKDNKTKAVLAEAEFELQTKTGTKVKDNLVTDENGKIMIADLEPGEYQFVETKAAPGYELEASPVSFTIAINQIETVNVTKENTAKTGSVVLTKKDSVSKAVLAEAEFELQTKAGTKVKDNLVADTNGEIIVSDLAPGEYQFVETKAPAGYKLDASPVAFTIDFNQINAINVTKENTAKTGSVVLTKKDSVSKAVLAEAEFELQTKAGTKVKDNLVTDTNGEIIVSDLAPGEYQFIETKAPAGYNLDINPVPFQVIFNQIAAINVIKENTAKAGSVVLTKEDSKTKAVIADAGFELQTKTGTKVKVDLVTDTDGKITVSDLSPGEYQFVETKAATGYELDATPVTFTIIFNQTGVVNVTKENTAKTGSVVLTKKDSVSKMALAKAEFELQTNSGTKVKSNLVTGEDGKITVADLAPGEYQFVETKAPIGYELDASPVNFTIAFNQATSLNITKENTAKTGSVILTKKDSMTEAELKGAEFELQTKAGANVKNALVTNENGNITVSDLAPGDYQFVETKAPKGYDLNKEPVTFTIEFNQQETVKVNKMNTMTTGSIILTKIDSQTKKPLKNATFNLVDNTNHVIKTLTTNAAGQFKITNLVPGNYQLIETKAPAGYVLDTVPVNVKIAFQQTLPLQVTKTNTKKAISGVVTAEFVDSNGKKLAIEEISTGIVGAKYKMTAKQIAGYKLVKDPANKHGTYKEQRQKVTFIYNKNTSIVVEPSNPIDITKTKSINNPTSTKESALVLPKTGDGSTNEEIFFGLFFSMVSLFLLRKRNQ